MSATDLADLSATAMIAAFRSATVSPVEVTEAVLARIDRWEPDLCALYALDAPDALQAARASEARWRRGEPIGPLDGVPITLKELIATRGVPVPTGTAATILVPAAADAPPAARVREAGAIILAKTTVPDYGMLSSGLSSFHALARNPWDLSRTPGGSSAGAGAAAAAGYGPLHVGTDIGGSVRLPAGWCGIFALKPSGGRVPIDPPFTGRVAGPMTRTVEDAALLMQVLSRPDPRDYTSLPPSEIAWDELAIEVKGLRIGLMLDAGCGLPSEPDVIAAIRQAAALFEAEGAIVAPITPFLTPAMLDGLDLFWRARAWADLQALPEERRERVLPFIRVWAEAAARTDGLTVYRGFAQIWEMKRLGAAAMTRFDYILSPTAPMTAFLAELPCPTNDPMRPFEHIGFTVAFNMTEHPASSIICGYDRTGLPIGLQIVGRRFDDLGVLKMSKLFEKLRGSQRPFPRSD